MITGKCPHCGRLVSSVSVDDITLNVELEPQWKGFSYSCSSCQKVLSVQLNPLAVNADLLQEIKREVRKELERLR